MFIALVECSNEELKNLILQVRDPAIVAIEDIDECPLIKDEGSKQQHRLMPVLSRYICAP